MRQSRKLDHIKYALTLPDGPVDSGFDDISLIHNCLPELSWQDISLATDVCGIKLSHPILINAITGGAKDVVNVNAGLAEVAKRTNSAMAVGSQFAALEDDSVRESYQIVRQINPDGIVFANVGAYVTAAQARQAVDMVGADALQIHLNTAQELFMAEGDREFKGYLAAIAEVVKHVQVPVIVKEVGCGIAREQAELLQEVGVRAIDVGGAGGTNFIAIEAARSGSSVKDGLHWGIPTVISAIEVASVLSGKVDLIVSGGVRSAFDVIKALAVGAAAVGIASPLMRQMFTAGTDEAVRWLENVLCLVKQGMLLSGAKDRNGLKEIPFVLSGFSREWLTVRKIDIIQYANRKRRG
ncbi:Isopentenyl-diphosphate delta-isomerase [Propionispora sp. 2/2-37]|uniref:type 2 isopentenyl-diphosphate Delta-isomerase n=1 Tax=Propionispora sp. 2/2-37 TaxID=1677858 RepID=UPI0006BB5DF0|nr:type 2 isopentenyl-diphosphate Delta-isomerase [Propionispora sp. 2/2-37]CUH96238.1 Isopentenyl-diphosphate delta-isomerase [Propionispora sp. 2/2-37]